MTEAWKMSFSLIPFVVIVMAAAASGAMFSPGPWYETLSKPSWTPPKWAFPVVWTTLYVMIAIAGWLVWKADGFRLALALWCLQLVLNAAWSWLMFGRHEIGLALVDAVGMWLAIAAFIVVAWPISTTASLLFAPYLVWVTIATVLNYSILVRNPAV